MEQEVQSYYTVFETNIRDSLIVFCKPRLQLKHIFNYVKLRLINANILLFGCVKGRDGKAEIVIVCSHVAKLR